MVTCSRFSTGQYLATTAEHNVGLSYGCFPPKVAATLKIPLSDAETIFNNYHQKLYPAITDYRENYVLPTVQATGRIHLGLGFYMHSDKPSSDIRTLSNAITIKATPIGGPIHSRL